MQEQWMSVPDCDCKSQVTEGAVYSPMRGFHDIVPHIYICHVLGWVRGSLSKEVKGLVMCHE